MELGGAAVRRADARSGRAPRELLGVCAGAAGQPLAQFGVLEHGAQRRRPVVGRVRVDQQPGPALGDRGRQAADAGGDHGRPGGLRLERDQAERFVVARHRHHVGGPVHLRQRLPGPRGPPLHLIGQAQLGGELGQPVQVGVRRPAHEHRHDAAGEFRVGPPQPRQAPQQHVGGLGRLYPAHERDHEGLLRQVERLPGPVPVAGGEDVQVHAGVDDLDPPRVGAVVVAQLGGLGSGVGDEEVGLGGDLLLADHARVRLGVVAFGQAGVLDLGEGVEGLHQRHPPPLGGDPPGLPGQPVVGVDEVVVPGGAVRLGPQQSAGEGAQLRGQVVLGQALEGAGRDVVDEHARGRLGRGRLLRAGGAGEDLDLDAAARQLAGGVEDVHVHAAGVTGAGLGERRSVDRHHGDPSDAALPTVGAECRGSPVVQ